ncbi:hypothetical protein [Novosphingobium sp. FKTRR1]|uniref:hypothetical protein n=1 Tax=Novosphingobium sp. FKTRR1 TaxID=2879118 RepID=UPI001CF06FAC|nr:hypothetical protein [Novosphingobium sp. FKTRR1]
MLALVVALAFPSAALVALGVMALTVRAQFPAVRRLLADSKALQRDREFLAVLMATPAASPATAPLDDMLAAGMAPRPVGPRPVRRARLLQPVHLRAAA